MTISFLLTIYTSSYAYEIVSLHIQDLLIT